jgi:hypothetical protein
MGFRFRKSIRIAPGIRINISKSGLSTSIGRKGFTWNSRGTLTVGIPGSGLSYRANLRRRGEATAPLEHFPDKNQSLKKLPTAADQKRQRTNQTWVLLALIIVFFSLFQNLRLLLVGALLVPWLIITIWFVNAEINYNRPRRR